jgi:hypothetical protein
MIVSTLTKNGSLQRLTQELMRHSDPSLTANIYTDVSQLPTFDAVASLEWEGQSPVRDTKSPSHLASQSLGFQGHEVAQSDTDIEADKTAKTLVNTGGSHVLTPAGTKGQMVGAVRFELTIQIIPQNLLIS